MRVFSFDLSSVRGFALVKGLASNQMALMTQYAVTAALPLVLIPYVIRTIGLEDFGTLAIALAFANYGALVVNYGFKLRAPPQIIQTSSTEEQIDVVLQMICARVFLGICVVAFIAIASAGLSVLGHPLSWPEIVMLFSLPVATCLNMSWYLQALQKFRIIAISAVFAVLIALAIGFLLLQPGASNATLVAAFALSAGPLSTGILTGIACLKLLKDSGGSLKWRAPWTELREGWPFFASHLFAGLYGASGVIIVGAIAGTSQAGAFSAAERIIGAIANGCLLVHTAAYPQLSAYFVSDRQKYRRLLLFVIAAYFLGVAMVLAGALLFWAEVQSYIFGEASPVYHWLLISALSLLVSMIFGTLYAGYLATAKRGGELLPLTLKILVFSLIVGLPGVWLLGAAGWFIVLTLSHLVMATLGWRDWRRES